jgi:hypothetical protein
MSTILRAYGIDFCLDAFLCGCMLPVCKTFKRGERVFPRSQRNFRRSEQSGVHIVASDGDFDDLQGQIAEAIEFLQNHTDQLKRLSGGPGIESLTLDFGIHRRNAIVQCDRFPPEVLKLAGGLGIGIELSHYPNSTGEDDEDADLGIEP